MARSLIGLDVGTAAVRAAEVRFGRGRPALVRFGQVALAPGAVVGGEVVDAAAVGAAIRRLWKEGGFTGKRVVTGVAGPRVFARTTDLPPMSDDELRSSLPFQVQELIPIPLDDAVVDHQVLETVTDDDLGERMRVLVVAAHRDVVRSLLASIESGGLGVARVDLIPFALIRALYEPDFAELGDGVGTAQALVDIGGGVTNIVVHEHGVPRFLRSLTTGGVELTEALVTDLDVSYEEAEALKRGMDGGAESEHAAEIVQGALAPVLEEIRSSLDFWQGQTLDTQLRRMVVTGGAARPDDVLERLEQLVGVPAERGRPFARVDASAVGLDDAAIAAAQAVASVAIGLALSGESLPAGARRINLLPGEIAVHQRERRQVLLTAGAVAAFAGLLLGVYALRNGRVSDAQDDAAAAEARTAQLQAQVAELQDVEALESNIATRRQTVVTVLEGDVAWGRLIQEVAAVLPNDVWLTSFAGTAGSTLSPGQVSFAGMGFDQTSTARWILRVSELDALRGLWVPSSARSASATGRDLVTFSSIAELTAEASSNRSARYAGGPE